MALEMLEARDTLEARSSMMEEATSEAGRRLLGIPVSLILRSCIKLEKDIVLEVRRKI
jgi:hypothetical protein